MKDYILKLRDLNNALSGLKLRDLNNVLCIDKPPY
jgi:hypothetical protein